MDPNTDCKYGGIEIWVGIDYDNNTSLDFNTEVTDVKWVCNGAPGATGATGSTGATPQEL